MSVLDPSASSFAQIIDFLQNRPLGRGVLAMLFIAALSPLLLAGVLLLLSRSQKKSVRENTGKLVNALEQGVGASPVPARPMVENTPIPSFNRQHDLTVPSQEPTHALPEDGLLALFADCYWCHQDAYASYLWKRLPAPTKQNLLAQPFLRDYATYLSTVKEDGGSYLQDPSYFSPLPMMHLDNPSLLKIVRESPEFFVKLSRMRQDHLALGALERLRLNHLVSSDVVDHEFVNKIRSYPASDLRVFPISQTISIRDSQEESELLKANLDINELQRIPSLICLYQVRSDVLGNILKSFSAVDLASAWIGPNVVLELLSSSMPERKRALVESYRMNIKADRNSEAFRTLWQMGLAALQEQGSSVSSDIDGKLDMNHDESAYHAA